MADSRTEKTLKSNKQMVLIMLGFLTVMWSITIYSGVTINKSNRVLAFVLDSVWHSLITVIIVIGAFMLILTVLGAVGILKESTMIVNVFSSLLTIFLIMEIVTFALACFYYTSLPDKMETRFRSLMSNYHQEYRAKEAITTIQYGLECCGVDGYKDWTLIYLHTPPRMSYIYRLQSVPCQFHYENTDGCLLKLNKWTYHTTRQITIVVCAAMLVQIITIFMSFSLANTIRAAKTESEVNKWENVMRTYEEMEICAKYEKSGEPDIIRCETVNNVYV